MTAHPAFRPGIAYGDRFDGEIRAGLTEGLSGTATARRIGIAPWFVCQRARAMGLGAAVMPQRRRDGSSISRPARRATNPSSVIALTITSRPDEGPSRLVRALRQRILIVDRDGLDPSHGVACLHAAGLVLPEIERLTGVPAPAIIEAVRRHCAPLGLAEASR